VIVAKAGDREDADLAPDALGGDAAAFLGAHDLAHECPVGWEIRMPPAMATS
jgi:hypothetical protein